MPSSADPASTQPAKKQSNALTKKPSGTVVGAKAAAPHPSTAASAQPAARPSARKTSGLTSDNCTASSSGSSSDQSSRRSASSGSASSNSDVKPPTPPKLSKGIKPGEFMPFETLQLPPNFPSLKDVVAQAAAKPITAIAKPTTTEAKPITTEAKPTTIATQPPKEAAKSKEAAMSTILAARPAPQNGK